MVTVLFFFFLWIICKSIKTGVRSARSKSTASAPASSAASRSSSALEALQAQRDLINDQILDITEQLDYCPPAKIRNQLLTRQTTLLGKLASVEQRIAKLCYA